MLVHLYVKAKPEYIIAVGYMSTTHVQPAKLVTSCPVNYTVFAGTPDLTSELTVHTFARNLTSVGNP